MSTNYTDLGICLRVICQKGSPLEVLGWLNYEFYGKKGQILYAVGIRGKNQVLFHKCLKTKMLPVLDKYRYHLQLASPS